MQAACKIAGYSFAQADNFRKAISNLSELKMQAERKIFIDGAISRGYAPQ
jgi:DNA polymerase III alpha subunit